MLMCSRSVVVFVKAVWELVAGGKQLGNRVDQASVLSYPNLAFSPTHGQQVSQSLHFISGAYREAHDTIRGLIVGVVVPNLALRTRDVEAFEDTPLEYVRGEVKSRRRARPPQTSSRRSSASGPAGGN